MNIEIWKVIKQSTWYSAFILNRFPPKWLTFSEEIIKKASYATLLLWKLDWITQLLPDSKSTTKIKSLKNYNIM